MGFVINFPKHGKRQENQSNGKSLENWFPEKSSKTHRVWCFYPLDSNPMVYFIICEMHGFSHQFPIAWKKTAKSVELGEPGKLVLIFCPKDGYFSSFRFPSHGILYHIFPSISNSTGKCNKIHPVSSQVNFSQDYCFYLFQNLVIS